MICSISGKLCEDPVVSKKTGHIYERRLILSHLETSDHSCPHTQQTLDPNDLIPIISSSNISYSKGTSSPSSIPQLLSTLQMEWDAMALETFTLRQHLQQTRQELSHALYQYDAACRVIVRLTKENEQLQNRIVSQSKGNLEAVTGLGQIPLPIVERINAKSKELAKYRKNDRNIEKISKNIEDISLKTSVMLHQSEKPGVLCLDLFDNHIVTGGNDKQAKVYNLETGQIEASLVSHTKKVTYVKYHPLNSGMIFTCSQDKSIKLWVQEEPTGEYSLTHNLLGHDDGITMCSVHPSGDYLLSSSNDGSWGFFDLSSGRMFYKHPLFKEETNDALCIQFHPDGAIFGTGSKKPIVQIWDINSQKSVAMFEGHQGPIHAISFSENGYHMASGGKDGILKLWDLRKLKSFYEIDLSDGNHNNYISDIHFDFSGEYLGVATMQDIRILKEVGKRQWAEIKTIREHKAAITGVRLAKNMEYVASTSMDRSLKIYA